MQQEKQKLGLFVMILVIVSVLGVLSYIVLPHISGMVRQEREETALLEYRTGVVAPPVEYR